MSHNSSFNSDSRNFDENDSSGLSEGQVEKTNLNTDSSDIETPPIKCLFCSQYFTLTSKLYEHLKSFHQFDFCSYVLKLKLDFYSTIKFINYIRREFASLIDKKQVLTGIKIIDCIRENCLKNNGENFRNDDSLLRPFLKDDPFLFRFEEDNFELDSNSTKEDANENKKFNKDDYEQKLLIKENKELRLQISSLKALIFRISGLLPSESRLNLLSNSENFNIEPESQKSKQNFNSISKPKPGSTISNNSRPRSHSRSRFNYNHQHINSTLSNYETDSNSLDKEIIVSKSHKVTNQLKMNEDIYIDSYSNRGIHEDMLKDTIRTDAYRDVIYHNSSLFKDKIVLDIGCGTGILCLFAAKCGAKRVIGIDFASVIDKAKQIVKANNYESVITLIKGRVEDVSLPEGIDKVDVCISEQMGYFLFYESMLPTVLYARDKQLKPDGYIFPDKASLFLNAIEAKQLQQDNVGFQDQVYGFNMQPMREVSDTEDGIDIIVPQNEIVTETASLKKIDIMTAKCDDLDFSSDFKLKCLRSAEIYGFLVFFDVYFEKGCQAPVTISTSPFSMPTHQRQTVFQLKEPLSVRKNDIIRGRMDASRMTENYRHYNVSFKFKLPRENGDQIMTRQFTLR